MSKLQEKLNSELSVELPKFLGSLTETELVQLSLLPSAIIAKIYQAGALFGLHVSKRLNDDIKGKQ